MELNLKTFAVLIYVIALSYPPSIYAGEIYPQAFNIKDQSHPFKAVVESEHPTKRISRHAFEGYGIGVGYPYVGERAALPSNSAIFRLIVEQEN